MTRFGHWGRVFQPIPIVQVLQKDATMSLELDHRRTSQGRSLHSPILDKVMFTPLRLIPSVAMLTDCSELL
jgi:hypothetical protein